MQTTGDRNNGTAAGTNSTDQSRPGGPAAGAATEIARHYGDHGQPATTSAGPSPQDAATHQSGSQDGQAGSAVSGAAGAVRDAANSAAEQAGSAMAKLGETAQDLASRAGEQASSVASAAGAVRDAANRATGQAAPAVQAVYDQGARAGEYMTRNVNQYPATAVLIAAAVGYGLAYLIHGSSWLQGTPRREHHSRHGRGGRG